MEKLMQIKELFLKCYKDMTAQDELVQDTVLIEQIRAELRDSYVFFISSTHGKLMANRFTGEIITPLGERPVESEDLCGVNVLEWKDTYGAFPEQDSVHDILDFAELHYGMAPEVPCYPWRAERKEMQDAK